MDEADIVNIILKTWEDHYQQKSNKWDIEMAKLAAKAISKPSEEELLELIYSCGGGKDWQEWCVDWGEEKLAKAISKRLMGE